MRAKLVKSLGPRLARKSFVLVWWSGLLPNPVSTKDGFRARDDDETVMAVLSAIKFIGGEHFSHKTRGDYAEDAPSMRTKPSLTTNNFYISESHSTELHNVDWRVLVISEKTEIKN